MSKVKTLQMAIEYINQLQGVLSIQSPHNNLIVSITLNINIFFSFFLQILSEAKKYILHNDMCFSYLFLRLFTFFFLVEKF